MDSGPQTSFSAIESETPPEGSDKVTKLKSQVDEVKKIMTDNVEKVLQRGERLEDLMDKSEDLESNSNSFRQNTVRLRRHLCLRNLKWTITMSLVAIVLLAIIIILSLYETGVIKGKN